MACQIYSKAYVYRVKFEFQGRNFWMQGRFTFSKAGPQGTPQITPKYSQSEPRVPQVNLGDPQSDSSEQTKCPLMSLRMTYPQNDPWVFQEAAQRIPKVTPGYPQSDSRVLLSGPRVPQKWTLGYFLSLSKVFSKLRITSMKQCGAGDILEKSARQSQFER